MDTFKHRGHRLLYSNTGTALVSGQGVAIVTGTSGFLGIAVTDIAATTGTGEVEVDGVHELTKVTGQAFTLGQVLYYDVTNKRLTGSSTGNTRAGRCAEAAASAATTAKVKLNQA